MKIPVLYNILVEQFMEFAPLAGKGIIEKKINGYAIKVTADKGLDILPFVFHIYKNDWPVGAIDAGGGGLISISEDKLIKELEGEEVS